MWRISLIFWLHFLFSLVAHILVPIMAVGALQLIFSWDLGFWRTGLMLGAAFFSCTYMVNHVTNDNGFCYLTALENYYREEYGKDKVDQFLPRFYDAIKEIPNCLKGDKRA